MSRNKHKSKFELPSQYGVLFFPDVPKEKAERIARVARRRAGKMGFHSPGTWEGDDDVEDFALERLDRDRRRPKTSSPR